MRLSSSSSDPIVYVQKKRKFEKVVTLVQFDIFVVCVSLFARQKERRKNKDFLSLSTTHKIIHISIFFLIIVYYVLLINCMYPQYAPRKWFQWIFILINQIDHCRWSRSWSSHLAFAYRWRSSYSDYYHCDLLYSTSVSIFIRMTKKKMSEEIPERNLMFADIEVISLVRFL